MNEQMQAAEPLFELENAEVVRQSRTILHVDSARMAPASLRL